MNTKTCITCLQEFTPKPTHAVRCSQCRNKLSNNQKAIMRENKRAQRFKEQYNMTLSEYAELYVEQSGKCKLCKQTHDNLIPKQIDKIRLICPKCFTITNYTDDNIEKILMYLERENKIIRKVQS